MNPAIDMQWIWIIIFIATALFELITPGNLITIWFSVGALSALVAEWFGLNVWIQTIIFILVSFIMLLTIRPIAQGMMRGDTIATNSDRIIGHRFRLDHDYNPQVWSQQFVMQSNWSLVSTQPIPKDTLVEVVSIDGVKLVIMPIKENLHE